MKIKMPISIPILKMLKNLRNACAHNNCLIADLQTNLTFIPAELGIFVSNIKTISKKQRQKKLSCLAMLEFVSTIYALKTIATKTIISKHRKALRSLFTDYFTENEPSIFI